MQSPAFVRSIPSTHADAPSSHAIACPPAPCPAPQFESPEGFKRRIRELFEVCVFARCSFVSARLKRITHKYVCVFYVLTPSLEEGRESGGGGGRLFHSLMHTTLHCLPTPQTPHHFVSFSVPSLLSDIRTSSSIPFPLQSLHISFRGPFRSSTSTTPSLSTSPRCSGCCRHLPRPFESSAPHIHNRVMS